MKHELVKTGLELVFTRRHVAPWSPEQRSHKILIQPCIVLALSMTTPQDFLLWCVIKVDLENLIYSPISYNRYSFQPSGPDGAGFEFQVHICKRPRLRLTLKIHISSRMLNSKKDQDQGYRKLGTISTMKRFSYDDSHKRPTFTKPNHSMIHSPFIP